MLALLRTVESQFVDSGHVSGLDIAMNKLTEAIALVENGIAFSQEQ